MQQTEGTRRSQQDRKELDRAIKRLEKEIEQNPSTTKIKDLRRLRRMRV